MVRKKILYFHHGIGLGGAPKSLSFLIAGLDKNEFQPTVVMPKRDGNGSVKSLFLNAGARVLEDIDIRAFNGSEVAPCYHFKERLFATLAYNRLVKSARKLVTEIQPDLVHLNSTCLVAAAKGAHSVNKGLPVIAHVREPLLKNWWGRMLANMNLRHVDWFVGIDQYGLNSVSKKLNGNVIYNFVDRKEFCPDPLARRKMRIELGWQENEVIFLSLSRISEANGALQLAELIESCERDLPPNAKFAFAGFGHPTEPAYELEAGNRIDANERCQRLPFFESPGSIINAADVIIAPFTSPHSARSVFEGASMGKPSLVTNLPNLTELIVEGETGFSYNSLNEETFLKATKALCNLDKRKAMGTEAIKLAIERFDQQSNVLKTVDVYRHLLEASQF